MFLQTNSSLNCFGNALLNGVNDFFTSFMKAIPKIIISAPVGVVPHLNPM